MRAKGPGQSALLLLDVIERLQVLRVPYAIIGAFAASFHGVVRASLDADALISLSQSQVDIKGLTDALRKAGLKSVYRTGDVDDPVGAVVQVEDGFRNRVDLLMNMQGVSDAVFSRTIEAEFIRLRVRVIGVEDFIAMKILAGSPKDLDDAAGVLRVSYHRANLTLLNELVRPHGKAALRTLESLLRVHRPTRLT